MAHLPRKRFGQHFLHDEYIIQQIITALQLNDEDDYIEIGPGLGALTIPVLKKITALTAIELDRDVIETLIKKTTQFNNLTIYPGDALSVDFNLFKKDRPLHVFGNLPYNISTPLLFHLLSYSHLICDITIMLQKEVAERLIAKPRSEHYGRLSVMTQYYCQSTLLFNVPNDAFHPRPKVASSMVRLIPHPPKEESARDEIFFADLVRHAFAQRRKTLRNSLKLIIDDKKWAKLNIPAYLRAEELSLEDFILMSNQLLET